MNKNKNINNKWIKYNVYSNIIIALTNFNNS